MLLQLLESLDRKQLLKLQQALVELLPETVEVDLWNEQAIKVTRTYGTDKIVLDNDKIVLVNMYHDGFSLMGDKITYKHLGDLIIPIYNKLGWVTSVDRGKSLKAKANQLWSTP